MSGAAAARPTLWSRRWLRSVPRARPRGPPPPGRKRAAVIEAHLDYLGRAQRDDGGWTFSWLAWSPAAEFEWRGRVTVDATRILRAAGRC